MTTHLDRILQCLKWNTWWNNKFSKTGIVVLQSLKATRTSVSTLFMMWSMMIDTMQDLLLMDTFLTSLLTVSILMLCPLEDLGSCYSLQNSIDWRSGERTYQVHTLKPTQWEGLYSCRTWVWTTYWPSTPSWQSTLWSENKWPTMTWPFLWVHEKRRLYPMSGWSGHLDLP